MNRLRNKKFILFSFLISEKLNSVFDFVSGTLQRTTIHYRTTYYTLWRLTSIIAHSSPLLPPSLPPSLLPYPTLPRFFLLPYPTLPRFFLLPYPTLPFLVSFSYPILSYPSSFPSPTVSTAFVCLCLHSLTSLNNRPMSPRPSHYHYRCYPIPLYTFVIYLTRVTSPPPPISPSPQKFRAFVIVIHWLVWENTFCHFSPCACYA